MASRSRAFPGPASPGAIARHAGDLVRVGLATVLFMLTVLAVQRGKLSLAERDVFRLVNDLPDAVYGPVWAVMQLGNLFAPVVVGGLVILLTRRVRLGLAIATAGTSTWIIAKLVKAFVDRGRPAAFLDQLLHGPTTTGLGFVSGHAAVAAAIATVSAPYLSRRPRRFVWVLAWVVGFGRVYTGSHLPLDIVGGIAVGWFAGSIVHAAFGAPHYAPDAERVARLLRDAGIAGATAEPAGAAARSSHPFHVTTLDGRRLFAKVLDPERRDDDWVFRTARMLMFREIRDVDALAPLRTQIEHEAAATLAAYAAGVRVPRTHLAGSVGGSAVLVLDEVPGTNLAAVPDIGDDLLRATWAQVRLLHEHRIAHRDLVRANVLVDDTGAPWLVDFGNAEQGANDATLGADVAELLASLAVVVGVDRAVASARSELGAQALLDAVPALAPYALSAVTRRETGPELLRQLREEVAAGDLPPTPHADRPAWWLLAGAAVLTFLALPAVAGFRDTWRLLLSAGWRWPGLALVAWVAMLALQAGTLLASTRRRLALGRTTVAAAGANLAEVAHGMRGRRRHLVAYLRSYGVRSDAAVHGVHESLVVELAGWALTAVLVLVLTVFNERDEPHLGRAVVVFLGIGAVVAVGGALVRVRLAGRETDRRWLRDGVAAFRTSLRAPAAPLLALATAAGAAAALGLTLTASLVAARAGIGVAVPSLVALAAYGLLRLSGLSGLPVVEEAVLVAGLAAFGVPAAPAVAGVLVHRLVTFWLGVVVTLRS